VSVEANAYQLSGMERRNLSDRIRAAWDWLRSGPRTPGYPFTANWTLFSQAIYAIQTTFNHWFRARDK